MLNHWLRNKKKSEWDKSLQEANPHIHYALQFVQREAVYDTVLKTSRMSIYSSFKNDALFISGTVYNRGLTVQKFVVEKDGSIKFTNIGQQSPKDLVLRGWFDHKQNCLKFIWSSFFHNSHVVCDYEYYP